MAINYKEFSYFNSRPDVVKIFDDLDSYRDFCRLEMIEFDEAHLYNRQSDNWNKYFQSTRPRKPRGEYTRSNYNKGRNQ